VKKIIKVGSMEASIDENLLKMHGIDIEAEIREALRKEYESLSKIQFNEIKHAMKGS
jgi:hypothetical protein